MSCKFPLLIYLHYSLCQELKLLPNPEAEAPGSRSFQEVSIWRLADVRANRNSEKSSRLTKKQTLERFRIPYAGLLRVKLYVDI